MVDTLQVKFNIFGYRRVLWVKLVLRISLSHNKMYPPLPFSFLKQTERATNVVRSCDVVSVRSCSEFSHSAST